MSGIMAICVFAVAGCKPDGPRVVPVSGVVMRGNAPVAHLHLDFMPEAGRPSWGVSDDQGNFTLNYDRERDGAEVGVHRVFVRFRPKSPQDELDFQSGRKKLHPDQKQIVAKYGSMENSPLRVEVKPGGGPVRIDLD
jgi:hypothetical protein